MGRGALGELEADGFDQPVFDGGVEQGSPRVVVPGLFVVIPGYPHPEIITGEGLPATTERGQGHERRFVPFGVAALDTVGALVAEVFSVHDTALGAPAKIARRIGPMFSGLRPSSTHCIRRRAAFRAVARSDFAAV